MWPYGQIVVTSGGYHGEFCRDYDDFVSLMYLGDTEDKALDLMLHLVEQGVVLDQLKKHCKS